VLLFAGLAVGRLPSALAQAGSDASEAISVGTQGGFTGSVGSGSSLWYVFNYLGANQQVTITITYVPPDANQMDMQLFTGDPKNPTLQNVGSQQTGNSRAIVYKDSSAHQVFVRVINNNNNRTVTFNGNVSPTSAILLPTATAVATATATALPTSAGTATSTPGTPVTVAAVTISGAASTTTGPSTGATPGLGETSLTAAVVGGDGGLSGTIATRRAVWYRFWYGNPGANASVAVTVSPNADNADLNLYTGTDPNNLTQEPGPTGKAQSTLSRDINLPNMQYVYFAIANNNNAAILSYTGAVTPAFAPMTVTPTPNVPAYLAPSPSATASATATPSATAIASATPASGSASATPTASP
jgi:hypothetical protein